MLIENYLITAYYLSKLEIVLKFYGAMLVNMLLPNKIQEPCQIQISDNKQYFHYMYILSIVYTYILCIGYTKMSFIIYLGIVYFYLPNLVTNNTFTCSNLFLFKI